MALRSCILEYPPKTQDEPERINSAVPLLFIWPPVRRPQACLAQADRFFPEGCPTGSSLAVRRMSGRGLTRP